MPHPILLLAPPTGLASRRVAGLTLIDRAARTARAGGARLFVAHRDEAERERLAAEGETTEPISVALGAEPGSPLLVYFADVIIDRRVVEALAKAEVDSDGVLTADTDSGPSRIYLIGARARAGLDVGHLTDLDALERWLAPLTVTRTTPAFDTKTFAHYVVDEASIEAAEDSLFLACIKPIDGIISRNLNRKISLRISRLLVDTNILPNHVSVVCLLIALAAAVIALDGSYFALLIAGTLFQANSILDGVDGELARVKWAFSKTGEFLDSIGDDLSNFGYFGAVSYVAAQQGQTILAALGGIGLAFWALYIAFLYFSLRGTGRGDVMVVSQKALQESSGLWQQAIEVARLLFRRDGFVFLAFVFAVFGRASYILPVVFFGGVSTFVFAVRETLRRTSVS